MHEIPQQIHYQTQFVLCQCAFQITYFVWADWLKSLHHYQKYFHCLVISV